MLPVPQASSWMIEFSPGKVEQSLVRSPNPGVTMRSFERGWGSFTEAKEAGEPRELGVGEGHNTRILGAVLQVLRLQECDCFSRNPSISTACL